MRSLISMIKIILNVLNWLMETIGVAGIALFLGFILANFTARLVEELLAHAEVNRLILRTGIRADVESVLVSIVKISAYVTTCLLVLWHLGILWYLFVALLSILITFCVAEISINIVDFVPNFLSGMFIRRKHHLVEGKTLKIHSLNGKIRNVYATEIIMTTPAGEIMSVPYVYLRKKL